MIKSACLQEARRVSKIASVLQKKPFSVPKEMNEALLHHITSTAGIQGVYQQHEDFDEVGDALQTWADFVDG